MRVQSWGLWHLLLDSHLPSSPRARERSDIVTELHSFVAPPGGATSAGSARAGRGQRDGRQRTSPRALGWDATGGRNQARPAVHSSGGDTDPHAAPDAFRRGDGASEAGPPTFFEGGSMTRTSTRLAVSLTAALALAFPVTAA